LAKELLKEAGIEERNQPPNAAAEPRRHVTGNHFPVSIPPNPVKQNPTRLCVNCSSKPGTNGKKPRRESRYMCMECQVALCVLCFHPYHCPHSRQSLGNLWHLLTFMYILRLASVILHFRTCHARYITYFIIQSYFNMLLHGFCLLKCS
jgi:hypothetical protein